MRLKPLLQSHRPSIDYLQWVLEVSRLYHPFFVSSGIFWSVCCHILWAILDIVHHQEDSKAASRRLEKANSFRLSIFSLMKASAGFLEDAILIGFVDTKEGEKHLPASQPFPLARRESTLVTNLSRSFLTLTGSTLSMSSR